MGIVRLVALAGCLAVLAVVPGQAEQRSKAATVTVYNQGFALVEEVRSLGLPSGYGTVDFSDVPETVVPASLRLHSLTAPGKLVVGETAYEFDLLTPGALLDKYLGKQVKIVIPDPKDREARIVKEAKLLANNERPVFETDQGVYLGSYEAVIFPEAPKGLRQKPALVLHVDNKGPAEQEIEAGYLADGFSWRADYNLTLSQAGDKAQLSCQATVSNQTGKSFSGAAVRLVAGDVRRVGFGGSHTQAVAMRAAAPAPAMAKEMQNVSEEPVFEHHVYALERPLDLPARQSKQVALFSASEVGVSKEIYSLYTGFYPDRLVGPIKQPATIFLKIQNEKKNSLGRPLPRGVVRVYQQGGLGETVFVGEDSLSQVAKGGEVKLNVGQSFDVAIERKLVDYKKIGKSTHQVSWEITVKSARQTPAKLVLEDRYPGAFTVRRSSVAQAKSDARTVRFEIALDPSAGDKPIVVSYDAEYEL